MIEMIILKQLNKKEFFSGIIDYYYKSSKLIETMLLEDDHDHFLFTAVAKWCVNE